MNHPIICLITSGEGVPPARVREAALAGIDLVQIREPKLQGGVLWQMVRDATADVAGTSCRVVVSDRYDIAVAAGAAGVHLRGDSMPAPRVRAIAPHGFLIGRSVHDPAEAAAVTREGGCDYLIFGTVFSSASKPAGHPVAGLAKLSEVCRSTTLPVIAVGGISVENARDVIAAGAEGIAAIGLFSRAGSLDATVCRLRREFDTSSRGV